MAKFSARLTLSERFQTVIKGNDKFVCPFCQHKTMAIAPDDQLAKCFHPSCLKYINQHSMDGQRNPLQACLWALAEVLEAELVEQSKQPKAIHSSAWQYLTEERRIVPEVLHQALIGAVPKSFDVASFMAPYRAQLAGLLEAATQEEQRKRCRKALESFGKAESELMKCVHAGQIAFFYTSARQDILSIKFRAPFTKSFTHFKPFARGGVYQPLMTPPGQHTDNSHLLVVEGEFNALQLASVVAKAKKPPAACVALGSATGVDWQTLKTYRQPWVLFQDHDEAGNQLVQVMQSHRTFWCTQAPLPDDDLDTYLRRFSSQVEAYDALTRLLGEAKICYRTLASIAEEIKSLRRNTERKKEFEVSQAVADLVAQELAERGQFYKTTAVPYYFDGESHRLSPVQRESQGLALLLHQMRLNASEGLHNFVVKHLVNDTFHHGKTTEVHKLLYYNAKTNTLYWSNGPQQVIKITASHVKSVANGTDGILFLDNPNHAPFQQIPYDPERDYLDELLLTHANYSEDCLLSGQEQRLALKYYFLSLFFPTLMKTRPLLCPVAEKGSGKSSLLRRIGQILIGPDFDVTPLPEKQNDFNTILANNYYLALDNVDEKSRWLNDSLAICATGGTIRQRTLYTTADETAIKINTFVSLNSRTPSFRRDDVAERLLLLYLKPWAENKRPEGELNRELHDNRDALLSWLVGELQEVLKGLAAETGQGYRTSFRLADFASFCYRIAKYRGQEAQIESLFQKLANAQSQFTLEADPLFELLQLLVELGHHEWYDAKSLHQKLGGIAEANKINYSIRNPQSLGRRLKHLLPNINVFLDAASERRGGNVTFYRFKPKATLTL